MSWFTFSLLSVFALATAELVQQRLLNIKNPFTPRTSAVLTFLFQSLVTIPLILISPLRNDLFIIFQPTIITTVLFSACIGSIGMVFYLKSFQVKNISLSSIFVSSSVVISTFLGIIFLNETTYPIKFLGIFLVLLAIVSLNYKNVILEKNHFYGLLAGLIFGITYTVDKSIVVQINPIIYIFWAFFLVSVFGFLFKPTEVISSIKGKRISDFKLIFISGVGYFLYNFLTFTAYVFGGEVGRIDAINNSQVFLIILFEYFILKHKSSIIRKLVTAMIAFIGVLILGFN